MTQANVVVLIDLQNGFSVQGLSREEGGSLYVPEGEKAAPLAADLIHSAHDTVFVLSQDFHPADHISFASNHREVEPFSNIFLRQDIKGKYRAVAAEVGQRIRAVDTDRKGYITHIRHEVLPPSMVDGALKQTLWFDHCKQGTLSSSFVDAFAKELPLDLQKQLKDNLISPILESKDKRGNSFYVVRKGIRPDLDSYGIVTENDGVSITPAPIVFEKIAQHLHAKGIKEAAISIGGLATNYCVEYSHRDLWEYLVPTLKVQGIDAHVQLLTDLCHGIPSPNLEDAPSRMMSFGSRLAVSKDLMGANGSKSLPRPL